MRRILIANSKGGSGKTTVASNLSVALSSAGFRVCLLDTDPQGSSLAWSQIRAGTGFPLHCLRSFEGGNPISSGWSLRVPVAADVLVVDSPAGLRPNQLAEFVRRVDTVLVPFQPSAIDVRASLGFIAELGQIPAVRLRAAQVGLVANRVKARTLSARELPELLAHLPFPLVASLRDSQSYVLAGALGRGLFDFPGAALAPLREDWSPLLAWLGLLRPQPQPSSVAPANVQLDAESSGTRLA